jgi:hypothetical protein
MKLPYAMYVSGSIWLFCSVLQQFNKVYMENGSFVLKAFNLIILIQCGKLVYKAIAFSDYL